MLTSARGRAIWRVDDEDRVPGEELIGRQPAFSRLDGDRKPHLLEAAERERRIRLESGVTAPGGINGVTERHALFVCDKDDKRCHAPEISRNRLPQLASLAGTGKWLQEISFRVLVTRKFNELKTVIYRIVFKPPIH